MNTLQSWLNDAGSFSQRVLNYFKAPLEVVVLSNNLENNTPYGASYVRRVFLLVEKKPYMYAESFLPKTSLNDKNKFFLKLGNSILGQQLFGSQGAKRLKMHQGLKQLNLVPTFLSDRGVCPFRESTFIVNERPLYLHEYFLPDFLKRLKF